jgi:hypothetical protein
MTQSNKRMHATADTRVVMLRQPCGAARDARRYAASMSTKGSQESDSEDLVCK